MDRSNHPYVAAPQAISLFLRNTLPFSELGPATLDSISKRCFLEVFPKGRMILEQGMDQPQWLYIIQSGGVKAYAQGDEKTVTLKEYGGVGESFPAAALMKSEGLLFTVEAVEDTFCILLRKQDFLRLIAEETAFENFYKERLSQDVILAAYSEHRLEKVSTRSEEAFYLFNSRAIDMAKGRPRVVSGHESIRDVAALMARDNLTCVLVKDPGEDVRGIVTTVDLRKKVVADALDVNTPVERIMNGSVVSIPAPAPSFEAVITMMEHNTDHVVVQGAKEISGIVNAADLMAHIGSSPLFLFREISSQRRVSGLHNLARKVPVMVRSLLEAGARAGNISQMLTVFTDTILDRMLNLIQKDLGEPPAPFDWLGFGSEGRKEQTFLAEQDNGLIYEDSEDPGVAAAAKEYFRFLGEAAVEHLHLSAFPKCRNDFMASNPRWRQTWSVWREYYDEWIMTPMAPDIYLAIIFFDFRSVVGAGTLARALRSHVEMRAHRYPLFLKFFTRYFLLNAPPISFYESQLVEKDGAKTDLLDIKTRTLTPFVDFARIMALFHGIGETNTLGRLRALAEDGYIPDDLYSDACHAYEYDLHLCFVHQLRTIESGEYPVNFTNPGDLTELERKTLKFSFSVIERLMDFARSELNISPNSRPPDSAINRA